ncbi:MAG: sigma 54-interacting transcriptional regulator, partial [Myxococcales bacterium]|nr:sigma 54-interacting transcriptional regulator [Myxococcales bacterium]
MEVENGRRISREHVFEGSSFRVGSDPDVEVVLDDPEIAGCHIRLDWDGRTWWASDTGKGTVVRGMRIDHVEVPHDDALVELGGSRLWLRHRGAGDGAGLRDFGDLVGASSTMQSLIALLRQVARADANVLLVGESGTGKELVATELVRHGPRATKPLVVVDCAALAPSLVESELFGHRRGAFTSADRDREGAFEAADGGTVLLDEIGELPANVQPKLLRVLESGTVRRLGDNHAIPVDVRVIAATN